MEDDFHCRYVKSQCTLLLSVYIIIKGNSDDMFPIRTYGIKGLYLYSSVVPPENHLCIILSHFYIIILLFSTYNIDIIVNSKLFCMNCIYCTQSHFVIVYSVCILFSIKKK